MARAWAGSARGGMADIVMSSDIRLHDVIISLMEETAESMSTLSSEAEASLPPTTMKIDL